MEINIKVEINENSCEGCDFCEKHYNYGFCHLFRDNLFTDEGNDSLPPHPNCIAAREQLINQGFYTEKDFKIFDEVLENARKRL